jgi:membrane protein required for colicin V production
MIDLLFILVLAYGVIRGLFKGFIVEAVTFAGLLAGLFFARQYSLFLAEYISGFGDISSRLSLAIAFLMIVIVVAVVFYVIAKIVEKIAKIILLGWLDKLLGMVFGLFKYLVILSLAVNVFCWINDRFQFVKEEKLQNSRLFEPVKSVIPALVPYVDFWEKQLE